VKVLANLVPFHSVVGVELVLEDPFAGDDVRANGVWNKIPVVVGNQGNKFSFHDAALVQIDEGGVDGGGHR
jgi:hypothetical protein